MRNKDSSPVTAVPATDPELVRRVGESIRRMGAQSVITSRTVAERFGLNTTDLEVLDLIFLRGKTSAGELADLTGLTSGSVTALIDRLVRSGHVERAADPADRRRVLVGVRHEAIAPIKATYASMQRRMSALWSTYSAEQLEVIADFIARSTDLQVACVKDIRRAMPPSTARRRPPRTRQRQEPADGMHGPRRR